MATEWPLVRNGDKGANVKALQRLLVQGSADIDVDGIFGPETEAAVKSLQTEKGLGVDGIVGPETWPAAIVEISNGAQGEAVTAAQELLASSATDLAADGIFGPETEKAVREFQEKAGLDVDGIVGPHTWQALVTQEQEGEAA
jgi:zinc D-Ala-D-Ala carboxypeptidase